jgi:hypothetical protein
MHLKDRQAEIKLISLKRYFSVKALVLWLE